MYKKDFVSYRVVEDCIKDRSLMVKIGVFGRVSSSAKRKSQKAMDSVVDAIIHDTMGMPADNFAGYLDGFLDCIVRSSKVTYCVAMKLSLSYLDVACHNSRECKSAVTDGFDNIFYEYCKLGNDQFLFSAHLISEYANFCSEGFKFSSIYFDPYKVFNYLIGTGDAYYSDCVFLDYYFGNTCTTRWEGSEGLGNALRNVTDMLYKARFR